MQNDSQGTGYKVTFKDFVALLSEPAWKESIRPLVEKWFNCKLETAAGQPSLRSAAGEYLDLSVVHEQIQSDKDRQYTLYQAAMNLWR